MTNEGLRGRVTEGGANGIQLRGAGDPVDQRDAIEQKRGGEGAQQEILQRGFVVALVVAQIAGQDVGRDRGDLEPDEDHDQIVGGHHQALSGDGEQQQGVVFAGFGVLAVR